MNSNELEVGMLLSVSTEDFNTEIISVITKLTGKKIELVRLLFNNRRRSVILELANIENELWDNSFFCDTIPYEGYLESLFVRLFDYRLIEE